MAKFGGYANFDEYFDKEERVYVRNRTNPLGYVSVNIGDNRNPKFFTVLKTVIPICLTDYFVKDEIRKSTDLRQLVMKGALELVSEAEYKQTVSPEMAEKVTEAMMSYESRTVEGQRVVASESEEEVKPAVVQLIRMNTLTEEERKELDRPITDDEIIAELETLDLSSVDKSYIFTNSKGKVKQWITKILESESGVSLSSDVESIEEGVENPAEPVDRVEQILAKAEQKLRRRRR
jgi:hypothetical protein